MAHLKIIIPMAGIGKRLGGLTQCKPKALVRLADGRLLDHVLESFQELEKEYTLEYIFIIGYLGEQIREHMKTTHPDKKVSYFVQEQLMGQSHAVYLAKDAIQGPIFLTYCDTINKIGLSTLSLATTEGLAFTQQVDDPRRHGVAFVGPNGFITNIVEKPKTMEQRSALSGVYYFAEGKDLMQAIELQMEVGIRLNNEYYLADAINILIQNGMRVKAEPVLQWLDAGTPEAVLETNACLLQRHISRENTNLDKSNVLIQPVYIHESSRVENSIVGPNVAVGANCSINGSIIRNTIIDDGSNVTGATLVNCLIGKGCRVKSNPTPSIVADYDEITVGG